MKRLYSVTIQYVSKDTYHVEADTAAEAVWMAEGSGLTIDQRVVRHYRPVTRLIRRPRCRDDIAHDHRHVTEDTQ